MAVPGVCPLSTLKRRRPRHTSRYCPLAQPSEPYLVAKFIRDGEWLFWRDWDAVIPAVSLGGLGYSLSMATVEAIMVVGLMAAEYLNNREKPVATKKSLVKCSNRRGTRRNAVSRCAGQKTTAWTLITSATPKVAYTSAGIDAGDGGGGLADSPRKSAPSVKRCERGCRAFVINLNNQMLTRNMDWQVQANSIGLNCMTKGLLRRR